VQKGPALTLNTAEEDDRLVCLRIWMAKENHRAPQDVAERLSVSPSTLRRWSREFADHLSESAGHPAPSPQGEPGHRRYTDRDVATLLTVKGLLTEGLSYEQVKDQLAVMGPDELVGESESSDEHALISVVEPEQDEKGLAPAFNFLTETLQVVANGQQVVLNSQQASRELLGVVLQDNFNLKEENAHLRDRLLALEREMAEMRRREEDFRESLRLSLEARLQQLEVREHGAVERAGCLASLLGIF
jgi:DNA-binding transcriptional MerR regulator